MVISNNLSLVTVHFINQVKFPVWNKHCIRRAFIRLSPTVHFTKVIGEQCDGLREHTCASRPDALLAYLLSIWYWPNFETKNKSIKILPTQVPSSTFTQVLTDWKLRASLLLRLPITIKVSRPNISVCSIPSSKDIFACFQPQDPK